MMTSSFVIRSVWSILISLIVSLISVFLGTPYSFFILLSSSLITPLSLDSSFRIPVSSSIIFLKFSSFSFRTVISVLVSLYSCNITIAVACSVVKSNFLTKFSIASGLFLLTLITAITSSSMLIALTKPSVICISFLANAKSKLVLFKITSFWWSI